MNYETAPPSSSLYALWTHRRSKMTQQGCGGVLRRPAAMVDKIGRAAMRQVTRIPVWKNPRTVLITGATGGIGSVLAESYAAAGRTLILHGRDPTRLAALSQTW